MSLDIVGIGTAVPAHSGDQELALAIAKDMCATTEDQDRMLGAIHRGSGVLRRYTTIHEFVNGQRGKTNGDFYVPQRGSNDPGPTTGQRMARYEKEVPSLILEAAKNAFLASEQSADAITHLVTVSCTGFAAPGYDVSLIKELGLSPEVSRTHVGYMGCHGALNGLRVARGYVEADPNARVLMCAAELCTIHMHYGWDPEKMVANALFADGAAALICQPPQEGGNRVWRIIDNRSIILDDTEDLMSWRVRDHGFEMTLSAGVPPTIHERLKPWMNSWLADHGLCVEQVNSWAIHPGGPKIVSAVGDALGLEDAALKTSNSILAQYGNMSSPTLMFVLKRLKERGGRGPCVAVGFGPGLAVEAALLDC